MANLPTPRPAEKRILRDVCLLLLCPLVLLWPGASLLHPESGPLGASKGKLF